MKTIYSKVSNLFVLLLVLAVSACQNDDLGSDLNGKLVEKDVALSFSYAGIVTIGEDGTRAAQPLTNEEKAIKKGVLLQFDAAGNLIKKYGFGLTTPSNVRLFVPQQRSLECVFIANASLADMGLDGSGTTTKAELNTLAKTFSSEAELQDIATNGLMMSAKAELQAGASTVNFILKPNVAKLVFSVTNGTGTTPNGGTYINITGIKVRNIHNRVLFAHHAADRAVTLHYAAEEDAHLIKEFAAADPLPTAEQPYQCYIPHNMSGFSNEENADKNFATYVEITHGEAEESQTRKLELNPANRNGNQNDYNVEAGNSYKINISMAEKKPEGTAPDMSGIVSQDFPTGSNCYMIRTLSASEVDQNVFSFPVSRVNEFWGEDMITDDTQWIVEVIWQDMAKGSGIKFCTIDGKEPKDGYIGKGGNSNVYFKLSGGDISGNVLVGLRKSISSEPNEGFEGKYLWSWHLWITDYIPKVHEGTNIKVGTYIYDAISEGDHLHRYPGDIWDKATGKYGNKFIMDRNLGATEAEMTDDFEKTRGLYYQFGSKNPIPYFESGNYVFPNSIISKFDIIDNTSSKAVGKETPINNPCQYYYTGTTHGSWIKPRTENPWNGRDEDGTDKKSIYDPCPPGWRVPAKGTWEGFLSKTPNFSSDKNWFVFDMVSDEEICFPIHGFRSADIGEMSATANTNQPEVYLWSDEVNTGSANSYEGYDFLIEYNTEDGFDVSAEPSRASSAFHIRCIQE